MDNSSVEIKITNSAQIGEIRPGVPIIIRVEVSATCAPGRGSEVYKDLNDTVVEMIRIYSEKEKLRGK